MRKRDVSMRVRNDVGKSKFRTAAATRSVNASHALVRFIFNFSFANRDRFMLASKPNLNM